MRLKRKLGFSLIELSVSLIIIAILMTAVIKGSDMIDQAKLSSARQKTVNSPVYKINGLALWLETSLSNSFITSETVNNGAITVWKDISSNNINATAGNSPIYVQDTIGGLPALSFNGTSNFLNLPNGTVPYENAPYSVFFVSMINSYCTCAILGSGNYGSNNQTNVFRYSTTGQVANYWWNVDLFSPASSVAVKVPHIIAVTYDKSARNIYINNSTTAQASGAASNRNSTSLNNTIGNGNAGAEFMNGYISEIIIFNRALSNQERMDVMSYLADKYKITIS